MAELLNLRNLRTDRGMTQDEVAELIDISPQQYRRYELGESMPTLSRLIILSDYFHVSIDYILERSKTPYTLDQESAHSEKTGVNNVDYLIGTKEGDTVDGRLIHMIECYKKCEDAEKDHLMHVAEAFASLAKDRKKES